MTLDPGTSAAGQLRSHLATSLNGDPAWDLALSRLASGEKRTSRPGIRS
jgi:hypothetical protein